MSSASVREGTRSALGPANQPVSTGWLVGCCVHQVGTTASDTRNDRSANSPRPSSTQNFVAKRSRILTTLPNPISAAAAARLRATGGNAISDRSGKGTVRIAAPASNIVPSRQCAAIPCCASSMDVTAAPKWNEAQQQALRDLASQIVALNSEVITLREANRQLTVALNDVSGAGPGIAPSASLIRVQTFMLTTMPTISSISSGPKCSTSASWNRWNASSRSVSAARVSASCSGAPPARPRSEAQSPTTRSGCRSWPEGCPPRAPPGNAGSGSRCSC